MTQSFEFDDDIDMRADTEITINLPPGHRLVSYSQTVVGPAGGYRGEPAIPAGAGMYGGAAAHDLATRLRAAGLSPDQIKGIQAMNEVEGGLFDPRSTLGFVSTGPQSQLGQGDAVSAFLNQQWNDPDRRGPGGSIPGVDKGGNVKDWDTYMTWIREKIVGQTGRRDWQGNQQPPAADYQNRLMTALPHFQHGGDVTPMANVSTDPNSPLGPGGITHDEDQLPKWWQKILDEATVPIWTIPGMPYDPTQTPHTGGRPQPWETLPDRPPGHSAGGVPNTAPPRSLRARRNRS